MKTFEDKDLREALRRIDASRPQLPEGFIERVRLAAQRRRSRRTVVRIATAATIAAAATVALLFTLHVAVPQQDMPQMAEERSVQTAPDRKEKLASVSSAEELPGMDKRKPQPHNMAKSRGSASKRKLYAKTSDAVISVLKETREEVSSLPKEMEQCTEMAFEEATIALKETQMVLNAVFDLFGEMESDTKKSILNSYSDETEVL